MIDHTQELHDSEVVGRSNGDVLVELQRALELLGGLEIAAAAAIHLGQTLMGDGAIRCRVQPPRCSWPTLPVRRCPRSASLIAGPSWPGETFNRSRKSKINPRNAFSARFLCVAAAIALACACSPSCLGLMERLLKAAVGVAEPCVKVDSPDEQ